MSAPRTLTIARLLAAMPLALLALAAGPGQAALAQPAHSAVHGKSKKHKKKSTVLVHCASVSITCRANSHERGPAGPTGPTGAPGAPGTPGHGNADRLRWEGSIASSDGAPMSIPLTQSSFAQAAGQDERLLGLVTITDPAGECKSGEKDAGTLEGAVLLDGKPAGLFEGGGSPYAPGETLTMPIAWTDGLPSAELATVVGVLPVTAVAQTHVLTIEVADDCNAGGASHFTVDSFALDVLTAS